MRISAPEENSKCKTLTSYLQGELPVVPLKEPQAKEAAGINRLTEIMRKGLQALVMKQQVHASAFFYE